MHCFRVEVLLDISCGISLRTPIDKLSSMLQQQHSVPIEPQRQVFCCMLQSSTIELKLSVRMLTPHLLLPLCRLPHQLPLLQQGHLLWNHH